MMITGWAVISVPAAEAGDVAARLLDVANDPATWTLANMGATVIRSKVDESDLFYFSPQARVVLAEPIGLHDALPTDPPRVRELVAKQTSRMMLGFQTRWEAFVPPRPAAKGIPAPSRPAAGGPA